MVLNVFIIIQEPLNSGDDVSDEEDQELFDTENVVVCQYDKVSVKSVYLSLSNSPRQITLRLLFLSHLVKSILHIWSFIKFHPIPPFMFIRLFIKFFFIFASDSQK